MFGGPQFVGCPIKLPQSDTGGSGGKGHAVLALLKRFLRLPAPAPLKQQSRDD
jgi:hypothetical protein